MHWNPIIYCITPLRFNESKYYGIMAKMRLLSHCNSSQKFYDLQQEIKKTFLFKLADASGMDACCRYHSFI